MYYDHPDVDAAYRVPDQYLLGDRLLVAPITTPDDGTRSSAPCEPGCSRPYGPTCSPGWCAGNTEVIFHRDLDPRRCQRGSFRCQAQRATRG